MSLQCITILQFLHCYTLLVVIAEDSDEAIPILIIVGAAVGGVITIIALVIIIICLLVCLKRCEELLHYNVLELIFYQQETFIWCK